LTEEKNHTILVLEDNDPVRMFVCRTLKRFGYEVLEAWDYESAMTTCKECTGKIQMILSDVIMPDMNGPEIVEHIEKLYPEIRVLYMSAFDDNIIAEQRNGDEDFHFIQKPFSVDDLIKKIEAIFNNG